MHEENKEENNNNNDITNTQSENDIKNDNNNEINKNISEIENKDGGIEKNEENKKEEEEQKEEKKETNEEENKNEVKSEENKDKDENNENKDKEDSQENKNVDNNNQEENKEINEEKKEEKEEEKKEEEKEEEKNEEEEKEDKKIEEEKSENNKDEINIDKIKENHNEINQNQADEKEIKEESNKINEELNKKSEEEKNKNEEPNMNDEEQNNKIEEQDNKEKEVNEIKEEENKIEEENNIKEVENNIKNGENKINDEQNKKEEKNIEEKENNNNQLNTKEEIISKTEKKDEKVEINEKNELNTNNDENKENKNEKNEIKEEINTEINNNQMIIENKKEEENNIIEDNKKEEKEKKEEKKELGEKKEEKEEKEKDEINEIKEENTINENLEEQENKNEIIIESNNNPPQEIPEDIRKVKLQESKYDQEKYLVNPEEDKEYSKIISAQMKANEDLDDSDEEEEETFPFSFVGDVQKKGEIFGLYNNRYLEIDSIKGLIKRYASSKEYPKNPLEIIPIKSLKTLKKVKKSPKQDFFEFNLSYIPENKTKEKMHTYRVRHVECRAKWFESLQKLYKHFVKGEPLPKINKNKLIFIDDQVGINQEIKQNTNKKKKSSLNNNTVFLRNFKILGELGVGAFGTVFKVQHILTEKIYAMKVMNKNYIIQKKYLHYVVSEFEIMKSLTGFPFVIDLHYCFQSANYLFMVIDICPGGDFDNLKYINNLKLFFAELVLAFEHIHKHHVVYRDLKPENILLDPYGHIKVCDFNLAKGGVSKQKRATSFCGSPMYLSPEMLEPDGVDQRADIYGIGLLIYELVTDKPAFMAPNLDALYKKIKNNRIDFNDPKLKGDLKDLLQKILVVDPDERYSIEEIKKHPYFNDIDFEKVLKREYGPIIIKKKDESEINIKARNQNFKKNILDNKDKGNEEKIDEEKKDENDFKEKQKKLDENKEFSFLDGKISVREMKKDQKRAMKNYVREFYFIKNEDQPQTEEFHLTVNGYIDLNGIL